MPAPLGTRGADVVEGTDGVEALFVQIAPGDRFPRNKGRRADEIDMYVGEQRAEVTGDIQRELLLLA